MRPSFFIFLVNGDLTSSFSSSDSIMITVQTDRHANKYTRATNHGKNNNWSSMSLNEALAEIRIGKLKASVVSRAYGIPETTLRHYMKLPDGKYPVNGGRFCSVFR